MGCLVDMAECTMMVTLNGEVLFNGRGSELAAKDFDIGDGLGQFMTSYLTDAVYHNAEEFEAAI